MASEPFSKTLKCGLELMGLKSVGASCWKSDFTKSKDLDDILIAKVFKNQLEASLPSARDHRMRGGGNPSDWQSIIAVRPLTTELSIGSILQLGGTEIPQLPAKVNKIGLIEKRQKCFDILEETIKKSFLCWSYRQKRKNRLNEKLYSKSMQIASQQTTYRLNSRKQVTKKLWS